jgi:hypothetical protein
MLKEVKYLAAHVLGEKPDNSLKAGGFAVAQLRIRLV